MNTVTHGLAPLLIAHACLRGKGRLSGKQLVVVGLCGAAPDLLDPHLTLADRQTSWSHGLPAWVGMTLVLILVALVWKDRCPKRLVLAGSLAYLFHLFCDAIAGGINWLSPFGKLPWGEYWFPVILWTPTDVVLVLATYFVFRAIPGWKHARSISKKTE